MRHGHRVQVGPAAFRVGSDWAPPMAALARLYRGYPAPAFCDFTVRLEAERP